jgi:hypothetical protein
MTCKYSTLFGIPNQGLHKYRIFDIAIVDVIATFILAYLIHYIFHFNFTNTLFLLFIIGIVLHRIFCVRTTIDKLLFPR